MRKPRPRVTSLRCECGSVVTLAIPPVVYVRHVMGQREADGGWGVDCICGRRMELSKGDARRAA